MVLDRPSNRVQTPGLARLVQKVSHALPCYLKVALDVQAPPLRVEHLAHLHRPLGELRTPETPHAAGVRCSALVRPGYSFHCTDGSSCPRSA
jgi:hypothetical protein